jgi:hypothetical protein
MKMSFNNPLAISQGDFNDQLKFDIANPEYFASSKTGAVMDPKDLKKPKESIPTQLPEGTNEQGMRDSASSGSYGGMGVAIVQVAFQAVMKGSMNKVMNLVYYL